MPTKTFCTEDLLTVTTRRLISPRGFDGLYDILDFVTGEKHMTHQLPRAGEVVAPWLIEQHSWLAGITAPDDIESDEVFRPWIAGVVAQHGELHEVEAMPLGMYVGRDPLAELGEMAPNTPIIEIPNEDG
jgi:hypothetical protein